MSANDFEQFYGGLEAFAKLMRSGGASHQAFKLIARLTELEAFDRRIIVLFSELAELASEVGSEAIAEWVKTGKAFESYKRAEAAQPAKAAKKAKEPA